MEMTATSDVDDLYHDRVQSSVTPSSFMAYLRTAHTHSCNAGALQCCVPETRGANRGLTGRKQQLINCFQ